MKLLKHMSLRAKRSNLLSKAAMFGLDARIALVIFGALSVISGAALYSAIQNAKYQSYIRNFEEMAKAEESFYIDTGVVNTEEGYNILSNSNNIPGSNASYLDLAIRCGGINGLCLQPFSYIYKASGGIGGRPWAWFRVTLKTTSDWVSEDDGANQCVVGDSDCSRYVEVYTAGGINGININMTGPNSFDTNAREGYRKIFPKLDEIIDGGDGKLKGKIRASLVDGDSYAGIYYQYRPQRRLN